MNTILILSLVCSAVLLASAVKYVPAGQVYSLYRRGKPVRLLQAGTHLALPLLDRVAHKVSLAGQVMRLEDDARKVRGTVYWQVLEPERAEAVFEQLDQMIRHGAQEALVAQESLCDQPVDARDLSAHVKQTLNGALRKRGMMVTRVELEQAA